MAQVQGGRESLATGNRRRVFVSGVDRIANLGGGCLEVTFYVSEETESGQLRRIEADISLIMPAEALPDGIGKGLMALGRQVFVKPDGSITVMH